jgi:hypothetical protein
MRWHELGLTCWVEVSGGAAGGGVRDFNPAFRPGFVHGRAALGELLRQTGDSREPAPGASIPPEFTLTPPMPRTAQISARYLARGQFRRRP